MSTTTVDYGAAREELCSSVAREVRNLQRDLLSKDRHAGASARRRLATLRSAGTHPPGAYAQAWGDTLGLVPDPLVGRSDAPSYAEWTAHTAMTLFATHQQSQTLPMHKLGPSLGAAMSDLARRDERSEAAVWRRFEVVVTATNFDQVRYHLGGLVTLLRAASIPLDYGRLTQDLMRLQHPRSANQVRLAWGRDYSRARYGDPDRAQEATTEN